MVPFRSLAIAFLLAYALPTCAETKAAGQHQILLTGNWSSYGNGAQGFGYGLGYVRSIPLGNRLALQAGLHGSYIPSVNVLEFIGDRYGEKFYGTTYQVYEDARVYYLGVPADLRFAFATSAVRPYARLANRVDVKVLQTVEASEGFPICHPVRTAECLERPDFREAAFHPVVLRSALLLGLSHRLRSLSPSLELGIQMDATPSRGKSEGERSRILAVVSALGMEF